MRAARNGDCSQSVIVVCDGVWQASNPSPVKTLPGTLATDAVIACVRPEYRACDAAGRRLAIAAGARRTVNWAPDARSERIDSAWRIRAGSRPQVAVITTWSRASTIRAADRPALAAVAVAVGSRLAPLAAV